MLLFDSEAVAAEHRLDAIREMLRGATHPASFGPSDSGEPRQLRLRAWSLGDDSSVFCAEGTGMYLRRKESNRFLTDDSLICLSVQPAGRARISQGGHQYDCGPRSLFLTNMCDEYDYVWTGGALLDLSGRRGRAGTRARRHRRGGAAPGREPALSDRAGAPDRPGGSAQGARDRQRRTRATPRATCSGRWSSRSSATRRSRAVPCDDDALWEELSTFLRLHLRDPGLDERAIARALGVRARELRRLSDDEGSP